MLEYSKISPGNELKKSPREVDNMRLGVCIVFVTNIVCMWGLRHALNHTMKYLKCQTYYLPSFSVWLSSF